MRGGCTQRPRVPPPLPPMDADLSYVRPGSVLDVEMTMLDEQPKSVAIDEQANDDVVHLRRFRKANGLAN